METYRHLEGSGDEFSVLHYSLFPAKSSSVFLNAIEDAQVNDIALAYMSSIQRSEVTFIEMNGMRRFMTNLSLTYCDRIEAQLTTPKPNFLTFADSVIHKSVAFLAFF